MRQVQTSFCMTSAAQKLSAGDVNITVNEKEAAGAEKLLHDNGIEVAAVTDVATSLEDYYFNLVGGKK